MARDQSRGHPAVPWSAPARSGHDQIHAAEADRAEHGLEVSERAQEGAEGVGGAGLDWSSVEKSRLRSSLKVVGVAAIVAVLLGGLPTTGAEEKGKTFKVGALGPAGRVPRYSELYIKTLRDLGYVEGRNLILVERWAGGS